MDYDGSIKYQEEKAEGPFGMGWQYEIYRMFLKPTRYGEDRRFISNECLDKLARYSLGQLKIKYISELRDRVLNRKGRNSLIINELKALFDVVKKFLLYFSLSLCMYLYKWQKKN